MKRLSNAKFGNTLASLELGKVQKKKKARRIRDPEHDAEPKKS
jgi:hypothetical protein